MTQTQRYKYPLQLPQSLKETAARLAHEDGVSLNQWIVSAVAQKIGAVETAADFLKARALRHIRQRGTRHATLIKHLLSRIQQPSPGYFCIFFGFARHYTRVLSL